MPNEDMPEVVLNYFRFVNEDRTDELMELFHEDAETFPVMSPPLRGREQIRGYYADVKHRVPQHSDVPVRIWRDGTSYAVELEFKGVTAAGERLEFPAVDLFDVVDGRIKRIKVFWGRIPGRALPVEYQAGRVDRSVRSTGPDSPSNDH